MCLAATSGDQGGAQGNKGNANEPASAWAHLFLSRVIFLDLAIAAVAEGVRGAYGQM